MWGGFPKMGSQVVQEGQRDSKGGLEARLEGELERLKRESGLGHDLGVRGIPNPNSESHGEVKGGIIYVYDEGEEEALRTLKHEFIDYLVSQAIEPYRSVTNKLIQLLNEVAYKKKEEVVEALVKLL